MRQAANENLIRILLTCHFGVFSCDVFIESQKSIKKEFTMQTFNNLIMVSIAVRDMKKAREFYAEKLGLPIATDYRRSDDNWWVTLTLPGGGAAITLARSSAVKKTTEPGTLSFYLSTSDIAAAHKELTEKGVKPNEIQDDLYGPGSGVKWFNLDDPDGNRVLVAQTESVPGA
jgi:catechol 2,3-dioxygenase-like lactoylglutathione lyase family enzyme